jgi:carbamoyl-phosphate synthase large subunit
MKILVSGSGAPAGINTLRYLPEEAERIACDADERAKKRMKDNGLETRFYRVPMAAAPEFIDAVNEIIKTEEIDVFIPTVDEELVVLSQSPEKINARMVLSPKKTIEACNDKYLMYEAFNGYEFCPMFVATKDRRDLRFFRGKIFMKLRIGRGSRGTKTFHSLEDVPDMVDDDHLFSEYLPGAEYTVDALCDFKGNLMVAVPRLRMEVFKGTCMKGKTERNEKITLYTQQICKALKFIGPINLQFKLDAGGNPKLVEINPRVSGGLPITVEAGVNTLGILYKLLKNEPINQKELEWKEKVSNSPVVK